MQGKLYLIPTTLGDSTIDSVIPENVKNIIINTKFLIVENLRTARRYLKKVEKSINIDEITFFELNKHTSDNDISGYLNPIKENNIGIISEAGCPGVADPGAEVVRIAHAKNIRVIPLVGPSSILMSQMASGFNGQNFAFVGYIPIKTNEKINKLKELESRSLKEKQTQIFIEAPYRNMQLLESLIQYCNPNTHLCIACNITQENEFIKTKQLKDWKKNLPKINKEPTIFLLHRYK